MNTEREQIVRVMVDSGHHVSIVPVDFLGPLQPADVVVDLLALSVPMADVIPEDVIERFVWRN